MARSLFALSCLFLLLSLSDAVQPVSFLARFDEASTNVLGRRLNQLLRQIPEFSVPVVTTAPSSSSNSSGAKQAVPVYPVLEVNPPRGKPTSSVIVLHGMDSSPDDLRIIAAILRNLLPNTRFVMPSAPLAYVTYLKRRATSWFDITRRVPGQENVKELRAAAAGVTRLVEKERATFPGIRIIVLGMSQGGAVALTFYLAEKTKVDGVVGAATWLPMPTTWNAKTLSTVNNDTNLLMLHGVRDDVIPIAEARNSVAALRKFGRKVQYIEYPQGGHTLSEEITKVAVDIIAFVKAQLGIP